MLNKTRNFVPTTAGLCGLMLLTVAAVSPAYAEDDESFEASIFRNLLGGGSSRPDINYRERSPLVIPPARDLPSPETRTVERAPAWPRDPDVQRRREAAKGGGGPVTDPFEEAARPLSPSEMRRGTTRGRSTNNEPVRTLSDAEMGRPLRPSELGQTQSLFGMFGRSVNEPSETFAGEPSRSRMTEPPTGYRTPSPNQPYAAPKDSGSWFKAFNILDWGTQREMR